MVCARIANPHQCDAPCRRPSSRCVHDLPPLCCSYANARTSGLVVDAGAASTTVIPVQDGYPLMMGAWRRPTVAPPVVVTKHRAPWSL